jgi:subtilisin family serine protease
MERMLKVAHDQGIVLIAAAGNGGPRSPPLYPGADPNVIAVTATDANDRLFSRANRGGYIAVAAAGVDIQVPAPDSTFLTDQRDLGRLRRGQWRRGPPARAQCRSQGTFARFSPRPRRISPARAATTVTAQAWLIRQKAIQTAGDLTSAAHLAAAPGD